MFWGGSRAPAVAARSRSCSSRGSTAEPERGPVENGTGRLRTRGQWSAVRRAKAPERVSSILDGTGALRRRTPQSGFAFLRASRSSAWTTRAGHRNRTESIRQHSRRVEPVRNNASVAHPNEDLLGHEEAELVINVGRSLLSYLDKPTARFLCRQQRRSVFRLIVPKAVPYLCTLEEVQWPRKLKAPR